MGFGDAKQFGYFEATEFRDDNMGYATPSLRIRSQG